MTDSTYGPRYEAMTDAAIRENPRNEAESALRDLMIQKEAKAILDKHANSPSFKKALALELAKQTVSSQGWATE